MTNPVPIVLESGQVLTKARSLARLDRGPEEMRTHFSSIRAMTLGRPELPTGFTSTELFFEQSSQDYPLTQLLVQEAAAVDPHSGACVLW